MLLGPELLVLLHIANIAGKRLDLGRMVNLLVAHIDKLRHLSGRDHGLLGKIGLVRLLVAWVIWSEHSLHWHHVWEVATVTWHLRVMMILRLSASCRREAGDLNRRVHIGIRDALRRGESLERR